MPLLGLEPKLELSSLPVLYDAVSGFSTKEFEPLFREYESFTDNHRSYKIQWEAENLASGLYFIRFTSGRFSATKKLLLLK